MKQGTSLRLALDRDPHTVADAAERMAAFCRGHQCGEEVAFRIQVGCAELFNNVYEHGPKPSHGTPFPWVVAHLRVLPAQVRLVVLEPPGPAPARAPEPNGLPDWDGEAGRGLFILGQWFPVCRRRRWFGRTCWQLALPR